MVVSGPWVVFEFHPLSSGMEKCSLVWEKCGLFPPGFKLGTLGFKADAITTTLGTEGQLLSLTMEMKTLQIATPILAINILN